MAFVHLCKPARIPQLRAKIPVAFDPVSRQLQRAAQSRHGAIGEAQRIRAELVNHLFYTGALDEIPDLRFYPLSSDDVELDAAGPDA